MTAPVVALPSPPAIVAAAPSPVPAAAPAVAPSQAAPLRPLAVVEPAFPREGLGLGTQAVLLQARMTVAPNGTVTQVNFTQTGAGNRLFERAARAALLQWRFPEGAGERVVVQQIRFSEN